MNIYKIKINIIDTTGNTRPLLVIVHAKSIKEAKDAIIYDFKRYKVVFEIIQEQKSLITNIIDLD